MSSSLEQLEAATNRVEVPPGTDKVSGPVAWQSGVIHGRVEVLEEMTKFSVELLAEAKRLRSAGDEEGAMAAAHGGAALAAMGKRYIERMKAGT